MSSERGQINAYRCDDCGRYTVTIHVDDGTTPMFLACRAGGVEPDEAECTGRGVSLMYPRPPVPEPFLDSLRDHGWEWYAPDSEEIRSLSESVREHVEKGGVLLRRLTDAGRALIPGQPDGEVGRDAS